MAGNWRISYPSGWMPRPIPLLLLLLLISPARAAVVEEFTRLYPVVVERVAAPKSVEEVSRLVRENSGPVSIGGGRYSMGGQTATEGALQLDMRAMDRVLLFSPTERTIRVEAGITWRKIQEAIDPSGLSLKIMQSYANFTVGGALSVNCHGRYVNRGPVIGSVRSIQIVLADGRVVEASPKSNAEIFYGAIGGYGALGVITAATLDLEANEPLERTAKLLPLAAYPAFFAAEVKGSRAAVFHNADIYPPDYDRAAAITFSKTSRAVTTADRLQKVAPPNWRDRWLQWWLSERTYAKRLRRSALDPIRLKGSPVVWRNYEASYDVAQLEPYSRKKSTYVLQEYFVPVERFGEFTPKMAEIFRRHGANVINVSIRHAEKDSGSVMAWARSESFAFVVWYKQGTSAAERGAVEVWTRELIDAAIASGGTYYLPYQIVATPVQFHAAYPRAKEFFALKKKLDPGYKFRNKLWDAYLPPPAPPDAAIDAAIAAKLAARKGWARAEEQTFLTLPEWYIVYAADELADAASRDLPSRFPYFAAIRQFWSVQAAMRRATAGAYPPNPGYRTMIAVIGASFTVEYAAKGLYEETAGRVFERLSLRGDPARRGAADLAAVSVAREYGAFMHDRPWYEFPFKTKLVEYRRASAAAPWTLRKTERRAATSVELAGKAVWGKVIGKATGSAYAPEDLEILAWVRTRGADPAKASPGVKVLERLGGGSVLISIPRYEKFQGAAAALANAGIEFVQIAGNKTILATVLAPADWDGARLWGGALGRWPVLSRPGSARYAMAIPVARLREALADWKAQKIVTEHLYDY
jgi:FAD/FMN-containing dehydrogenase